MTTSRFRSTIRWTAIALVVALGASLTACTSSGSSGSAAANGGTLTWGLANSPRTLFGPTNFSTSSEAIMDLIQGHELAYTPTGALRPDLVSSWKAVTTTKYVYQVRSGAKFSDGHPVTAADVAYSLNLGVDTKLGAQYGYLFDDVASVTATGNAVTVQLKAPSSLWKNIPASIGGYVYEKSLVSKNLSKYGTPSDIPIGAGPYKVADYVPNSKVTLVRNPYYYGTKPRYDKIVFDIIPSPQTLLLSLQQGTIDGTFDATTPLKTLKNDATVKLVPNDAWFGLTMDMQQKPFDDIHVRRALYMATDREALLGPASGRTGTIVNTVNSPTIFYGALAQSDVQASYAKLTSYPFNLTQAKAEMAKSSVPHGFSTTMNIPEDSSNDIQEAQILKQDWAKIGVNLSLKVMPGGPRFQIILDHGPNLGIQIIGNAPDGPDPAEMAGEYFSIAQAAKGGNNSSNYKNATVNGLLVRAAQSTSSQQTASLTLQAQVLASKDVPVIPFYIGSTVVAVHKGWTIGDMGTFSQEVTSVEPPR